MCAKKKICLKKKATFFFHVGVCSVSAADVFQVDGAPTVARLNVRWRRR